MFFFLSSHRCAVIDYNVFGMISCTFFGPTTSSKLLLCLCVIVSSTPATPHQQHHNSRPPPPSLRPVRVTATGPGSPPVVNAGLLPSNYQLRGSAFPPGADRAENEPSPLGRTSGWAVYGGGRAPLSASVNGSSRDQSAG